MFWLYLSSEELIAEEVEGPREDNAGIIPRLNTTQYHKTPLKGLKS